MKQSKHRIHRLALVLVGLAALFTLAVTPAGARSSTAQRKAMPEETRAKAAYIYMEGVAAFNDGRYDDAYMLYTRASRLDPTDPHIAAAKAVITLATNLTRDSLQLEEAYEAMRLRFLADKSDYLNGAEFAKVAASRKKWDDAIMVWEALDSAFPARTDPALNLANIWLLQSMAGDSAAFERAMGIYNRLEQGTGIDMGLSSYKIRAYQVRGDTAGIVDVLEKLYYSAPTDPLVNLFVAQGYYAAGLTDSTRVFLDRACALDSTSGEAYLTRAEFYLQENDSIAYDREVFKALESQNLDFEPKMELLTSYVKALYADTTQESRIRQLFDVMQQIHPGEPRMHELYGAYLIQLRQETEAAEQFGYAADLDPDNLPYRQLLFEATAAAGDTLRAIEIGREATVRFKETLYFPIMTSALLQGRHEDRAALDLLDSFNVSDFQNDEAVSSFTQFKADLLYKLGMTDSAMVVYEEALRINPRNYMAQNNAAYFMAESNRDLDRAKTMAASALASDPTNTTYLDTYAWVLFKLKDYQGARQYIDQVLELMYLLPGDSTIEQLDNLDRQINELMPNENEAPDIAEEMVEEAEEVLEPETPSSEVYEHAGDIYFFTGDHSRALEFWNEALKLDPTNERIQKKVKHKAYFIEQ